jgi:hypothetical protein
LNAGKIVVENDIINDTVFAVSKIRDMLVQMEQNPREVRFNDVCGVREHYFGKPCQRSSSHRIYPTPWQDDPRITIQNYKGKAKVYHVKQELLAVERLEVDHRPER